MGTPPDYLSALPREHRRSREAILVGELPGVPGVQTMLAWHCPRLWRVHHVTYDFCVVPLDHNSPTGFCEWWYRGRVQTLPPGGVSLMEPGELHVTRRIGGPAHFYVVQVPPPLVDSVAGDLGLRGHAHVSQPQTSSRRTLRRFARLRQAMGEPSDTLALESAVLDCVHEVLANYTEARPRAARHVPDTVRRACGYIHERYHEPIQLEDLAAEAGLSKFHLLRSFATHYGLPPHAFLTQLRVAKAQEALRAGVPPAMIHVGFADQSHLNRHFKRTVGTTPGLFAASVRRTRRFVFTGTRPNGPGQ